MAEKEGSYLCSHIRQGDCYFRSVDLIAYIRKYPKMTMVELSDELEIFAEQRIEDAKHDRDIAKIEELLEVTLEKRSK